MNTAQQPIARSLTAATWLVALAGLAFQLSGCSAARTAEPQVQAAPTPVVVMPQVMVIAKREALAAEANLPVVQLPLVRVTARRELLVKG